MDATTKLDVKQETAALLDRMGVARDLYTGGDMASFSPVTGEELQRVDLPCLETTACAFGGPDLADLYVTTGVHKSVEEADAGRLFVIRGLGVKGLPAHAFAG